MAKLKACPFCGQPATESEGGNIIAGGRHHAIKFAECQNEDCSMFTHFMPVDKWNTRPIEDALQSELDALRQSISEAVEEINTTATSKIFSTVDEMIESLDEDKRDGCVIGADTLMDILRKHGLLEVNDDNE